MVDAQVQTEAQAQPQLDDDAGMESEREPHVKHGKGEAKDEANDEAKGPHRFPKFIYVPMGDSKDQKAGDEKWFTQMTFVGLHQPIRNQGEDDVDPNFPLDVHQVDNLPLGVYTASTPRDDYLLKRLIPSYIAHTKVPVVHRTLTIDKCTQRPDSIGWFLPALFVAHTDLVYPPGQPGMVWYHPIHGAARVGNLRQMMRNPKRFNAIQLQAMGLWRSLNLGQKFPTFKQISAMFPLFFGPNDAHLFEDDGAAAGETVEDAGETSDAAGETVEDAGETSDGAGEGLDRKHGSVKCEPTGDDDDDDDNPRPPPYSPVISRAATPVPDDAAGSDNEDDDVILVEWHARDPSGNLWEVPPEEYDRYTEALKESNSNADQVVIT